MTPPATSTLPAPTAVSVTTLRPPPTDALPGTTLLVAGTSRDDALIATVEPTQVTEPCPDSLGRPDGSAVMDSELARLEPILGVVLAYAGEHPDQFGSYGLIWHGTNDASVFVSFTSHLDAHRAALEELVAHPDELIVCQVAVSGGVARALMAKLTDELQGRFQSVALGVSGVEVVLMPGEQALADQLVAEFGAAVDVSVCASTQSCSVTSFLPVETTPVR